MNLKGINSCAVKCAKKLALFDDKIVNHKMPFDT